MISFRIVVQGLTIAHKNELLEEKLFFCCVHRKKVTFFMRVNPVFLKAKFCVCAVSKQMLFFKQITLVYTIKTFLQVETYFGFDAWYPFDKVIIFFIIFMILFSRAN